MKPSKPLFWLSSIVVALAILAAAAGIFYRAEGDSFSFNTVRGETVEIYGQDLYRYDTTFSAGIFIGTDYVTLFAAVPLLILALALSSRGSLRGGVLLTAMLGYFLYNSASISLGVSYNAIFLVYILYFAASFFALILALSEYNKPNLARRFSPRMPHRGTAIFLYAASVILFLVWTSDLVGAIASGQPPATIDSYTTGITYVIDLGIIVPVLFLAARLLQKRASLGYLLSGMMLTVCIMIGLVVIAQSVVQTSLGIILPPQVLAIFVGSFVVMSLVAIYFTVSLYRSIQETK